MLTCRKALNQRTVSKKVILSILNRQQDDEPAPVISFPSRLELGCMPFAGGDRYDQVHRHDIQRLRCLPVLTLTLKTRSSLARSLTSEN